MNFPTSLNSHPLHTYRRDIDGLRAFAILPVVLFHFRLPGFSGGFTGVDVFFVISGFLITGVIDRELSGGHFSFGAFYERRARRLFPALYVMLAACVPMAMALLLPGDYRHFTKALAAAAVFGANAYFWRTTGYFDGPSEHQPLLHTWSLAVEEQFYFLFPPLLLLAHRSLSRRTLLMLLAATVSVSFAATFLLAPTREQAVFYLPMFRAWELCLGAFVAEGFAPTCKSKRWSDLLAATGLAAIVASSAILSEASSSPHPVPLYACLGAAMVLYAGRSHQTAVARLLGHPWFVFIGLISYSLYLWHWPVWVFARYVLLRATTAMEACGLVALSMLLAVLSWRYVERPFRGARGVGTRKQILIGSTALAGTLCLAAVLVLPNVGRAVPADIAAVANVEHEAFRFKRCARSTPGDGCRIGKGVPTFALWGDSHAMAMGEAIENIATRAGRSGIVLTKSACAPLLGVNGSDREGADCDGFNARASDAIRTATTLDTVVLVSRWAINAIGTRYGDEGGAPKVISPLGIEGNLAAFTTGLGRTLAFLHERGLRTVVVTQVPEIGWHVPSVLARSRLFGRPLPALPSLDDYRERQRPVEATFNSLQERYPFERVDVARVFCSARGCMAERDGRPLYRDDDHLAAPGNQLLSSLPIFAPP